MSKMNINDGNLIFLSKLFPYIIRKTYFSDFPIMHYSIQRPKTNKMLIIYPKGGSSNTFSGIWRT